MSDEKICRAVALALRFPMALAARVRTARDLRWAARECGLPHALWEPLRDWSARRVLQNVAHQCASSDASPGKKAAAAAAWERYRGTFPPFARARGAAPKAKAQAKGKAKAKAKPAPKRMAPAGGKGRGRGRGGARAEDMGEGEVLSAARSECRVLAECEPLPGFGECGGVDAPACGHVS